VGKLLKTGWVWIVLALLSACATPPASQDPQPGTSQAPASKSQVFGFSEGPAAAIVPTEPTLDATQLPPFEGSREELRRPGRIAKLDRTSQPAELWQRVRNGFGMPNLEDPLVAEKTAWYAARPDFLKRTFERSRRYLHHIVEELERRNMPTEIALLPMVESSWNPMAYSRAHASGLWQFIPGTGKRYELAQNWWYDARRDVVASTGAALDYLQDIYEMHGDWHLALASYNWGEHAVARAVEKNKAAGQPVDYLSLTMPAETRHYLPKLQALKNIVANPQAFGLDLDPIPNTPYFTTITKTRDIDVELAAKLAEMPLDEFIALNPGFNRPLIPVAVHPRIVLPADRVEVFHANLQKYDETKLVSWQSYAPRVGENLEAIAKKFKVSIAQLKEVNGIDPRARALPATLVVPLTGAAASTRIPIMYAPPIPTRTARVFTHTVLAGETLTSIATKYRVSVEDLKQWNKVGRLAVGQKVTIHGTAPTRATAPGKTVAGKPKVAQPPRRK
jgi:membrane-bound lytic murein transglycosylase D